MKLSSPYKCDYCDNMKGETNHWWLLLVNPSFELHPWDENFLDAKGVEHICSQACAAKALSSWMSLVSIKAVMAKALGAETPVRHETDESTNSK